MNGLPLTLRDFLAYATSGAVLTLAVIAAARGGFAVDGDIDAHVVAGFIVGSYVIGHALGTSSTSLTRHLRLHTRTGSSLQAMLTDDSGARRLATAGKPLPPAVRRRVAQAAGRYGIDPGEGKENTRALSLVAEEVVHEVHDRSTRVDRLRMLYDFSRNMAAALALSAVALAVGSIAHREGALVVAASVCGALSVPFVFRYVHFFAFYQRSLIVAFTELTLAADTVTRGGSGDG